MEDDKTEKNLEVVKGIESRTVEDTMEDFFLRYSMSVIVDRALPDVRDGLKPVNRRILYTMNKNGWKAPHATVKSARIVGDVMGKYHPHGDSSIYMAMVNLAQPWKMRYTLIEGQGNFGSMDGDEPAAYRYTEARMDKIGAELLTDIEKETVDFRDNFDGTEQEPVVLPAALPNILLNGQMGIAVGMATNIPPHNLGELVDATVAQIDNPEISLDELMKYVKGPDFPTGAEVYGGAPMRQAYATGKGSVTIRAVANIVMKIVLVLILTLFFLLDGPEMMNSLWKTLEAGEERKPVSVAKDVISKMAGVISTYVSRQVIIAIIDGCATIVIVFILSLILSFTPSLAIPMGMITMLFYLIPMFGQFIGGTLVTVLLFFSNPVAALVFAIIYIINAQIENNIISPKIQGDALNLKPLVILCAITIGMYMFGLLGAIIAIPIAGCIKILVDEYPNIIAARE